MSCGTGLLGVACLLTATVCHADVVVHAPVGVSSPQGESDRFLLEYIIDQSGLSNPYTSGETDFETYVSNTTHRPFDLFRLLQTMVVLLSLVTK